MSPPEVYGWNPDMRLTDLAREAHEIRTTLESGLEALGPYVSRNPRKEDLATRAYLKQEEASLEVLRLTLELLKSALDGATADLASANKAHKDADTSANQAAQKSFGGPRHA